MGTGSVGAGSSLDTPHEKVVGETAMLLNCAASVQDVDEGLRVRVHTLAALLKPLARGESMLGGLCADPGIAFDRAVAHAVLSQLGHPDPLVDALLLGSKAFGPPPGPDMLAHRRLEQEWLGRVTGSPLLARSERGLVGRSMLGRPLDVLGASRFDVYAFTHTIMYATDLGGRTIRLPRPAAAIAADADAALSLSLEIDDFDVSAEVAMAWPMLALEWSPTATLAFGLLVNAHDQWGFVPGPAFERQDHAAMAPVERSRYVFATCYHTTYVMGILCAAALRNGRRPPKAVPAGGSAGAGAALARLLDYGAARPRWWHAFQRLTPGQQDAVAPLVLTILLRRAKDQGDLRGLRHVLELALAHRLVETPAARHAIDLLRRSALLNRIVHERRIITTPLRQSPLALTGWVPGR